MNATDAAIAQLQEAGCLLIEADLPDTRSLPTITLHRPDDFLALPPTQRGAVFMAGGLLEDRDFQHLAAGYFDLLREVRAKQTQEHLDLLEVPHLYDLRALDARLACFQEHLGQRGFVRFLMPHMGAWLSCSVDEPWWAEYAVAAEEAEQHADDHYAATLQAVRDRHERQRLAHLQRLHGLRTDPQFAQLARRKATTQKALLTLARTLVPDAVEALGDARAKEELGQLADVLRVSEA